MNNTEHITLLNQQAKGLSPTEILQLAVKSFDDKVAFATSLGEEDQVILDMIANHAPSIEVFTLDTGRLFAESYELMARIRQRYPKLNFKIYFPNTQAVENMVKEKGINLFYESIENRKQCCFVRKIEPLKRALQGKKAWITGLRRSQSLTRTDNQAIEWDGDNAMAKINPLIDWSLENVQSYIKDKNLDVNPLHSQGFVSIGCAPCTRAIKPGEDIRAGRWWWENPEQKECGLHNNPKWKGKKF